MWICQKLHSYLTHAAYWFVRSWIWIFQKMNANLSEAAYGIDTRFKWIGQKLCFNLSEVSCGFVRSCMWLCQKLYVNLRPYFVGLSIRDIINICHRLHDHLLEDLFWFVRSCMWIGEKLQVDMPWPTANRFLKNLLAKRSWIDSSRIYLLIFRSQTDSYSYSPQTHFMNIIPICKYYNFTNIILIQNYFSKYSWISYFINECIYLIWKYLNMVLFARWVLQMKNIYDSRKINNEKKEEEKISFRY